MADVTMAPRTDTPSSCPASEAPQIQTTIKRAPESYVERVVLFRSPSVPKWVSLGVAPVDPGRGTGVPGQCQEHPSGKL